MAQQSIAQRTVATVNSMGTDWPVVATVERVQFGATRPSWTLSVVCNGTAERFEQFSTRREALDAFAAV